MDPSPTFELFTCSYARFQPAMGTPIRTSNGAPRYKLKYELTLVCREAIPDWHLVRSGKPIDVFREEYHSALDDVGVEKFASVFRGLVAAGGDPRLVLLCFEAIDKPGVWCHRTQFAEWWTARTGDEVRELGPSSPDPHPQLF